jgi:GH15 family glucan-1,4-alpha-glucosidase
MYDYSHSDQYYIRNTPALMTILHDKHGNSLEVTDFAPRYRQHGRMFCPITIVRRVKPLKGTPRICIKIRPVFGYGSISPQITRGSNHIRYVGPDTVLRLTTDFSVSAIIEEVPVVLDDGITLILGPDETLPDAVTPMGHRFLEETLDYWRDWCRSLAIPFEWQDEVIRSAITLKLNAFEDSGAIIAAMTTSIPESPDSGRNWDYRFCWLRDGYFVINALNRLGTTKTMEKFIRYLINISANTGNNHLWPVYRINGKHDLKETIVKTLNGYRGMVPVRVGNAASDQIQNDVYGAAVLATAHVFFDKRLERIGDEALFHILEHLGDMAVKLFDQPDAGPWEFRSSMRVHTYSSVMCWAACDRLSRIADHLNLPDRDKYWRKHADSMHKEISYRAWNKELDAFVDSFDGDNLDASMLLLHEIGFVKADDPRFASTVDAIGKNLMQNNFLFRYRLEDDFGKPEFAFTVCTFWYIDALTSLGRREEARELFENLLTCANHLGLMSEHIDPMNKEMWGNFPQTYSMVGIINSAIRLSKPWSDAF